MHYLNRFYSISRMIKGILIASVRLSHLNAGTSYRLFLSISLVFSLQPGIVKNL